MTKNQERFALDEEDIIMITPDTKEEVKEYEERLDELIKEESNEKG